MNPSPRAIPGDHTQSIDDRIASTNAALREHCLRYVGGAVADAASYIDAITHLILIAANDPSDHTSDAIRRAISAIGHIARSVHADVHAQLTAVGVEVAR